MILTLVDGESSDDLTGAGGPHDGSRPLRKLTACLLAVNASDGPCSKDPALIELDLGSLLGARIEARAYVLVGLARHGKVTVT